MNEIERLLESLDEINDPPLRTINALVLGWGEIADKIPGGVKMPVDVVKSIASKVVLGGMAIDKVAHEFFKRLSSRGQKEMLDAAFTQRDYVT